MANIHNLSYRNKLNKTLFRKLFNGNAQAFLFFTDIYTRLKQDNDDFISCCSVDLSFTKDKYSFATRKRHIAYLKTCNIIVKHGSNKSWIYLVNPEIFHCLNYSQQKEYILYKYLFNDIVIE